MTSALRLSPQGGRRQSPAPRRFSAALVLAAVLGLLALPGCLHFHRELPRPGRTTLGKPLIVLPATRMGNYLVLEVKWDKHGPYHFLIDTGASVTLVSPELASRYAQKDPFPKPTPLVRVKSADGETALLTAVSLRAIELGAAKFENVPALIYDCTPLSTHLGVKIDGILGFPLFRETLLTLDYPHERVILQPRRFPPRLPGVTIAFNNERRTPIIPVRVGQETFIALIDSGSDAGLSLNPTGLDVHYAVPPRDGLTVATLNGDRAQQIGRLSDTLYLERYSLEKPLVALTDDLSSIGADVLKHFTVTFDQERNHVTFYRESDQPVLPDPKRSAGLSFSKTPAYWRVVSVVPGSSAAAAGVQPGDLVTRINGAPVSAWDLRRYDQLVTSAGEIVFTLLHGSQETECRVKVFELVP